MPGRLQDVILRDTRANQPLPTEVGPGAIYYVTDEQVTERVSDDGTTWEDISDAGSITSAINQLTGDVTAGPGSGSQAATIANDAVTNAKSANMAQSTIKGRAAAAGTGDPTDLTPDQVSTVLDGASNPFARTSVIPSAAITQLTGDVTAGPGSGSQAATIANSAVTDAKLRDSAALSVIGRASNSTGAVADITSAADDRLLTRISSALAWTQLTIGMAAANLWTFAKLQQISTGKILGRGSASTGDIEQLTPTSGIETTSTPGIGITTAARTRQIGITVDGGGSVVTAGVKGYKSFPVAGTVTATRLLADVSGSVAFKVMQNVFASYPPTSSVATPSLSGAASGETTGLSLAVAAGDVFGFEITGTPATITRVTLELTIVVTG